MEEEDSIERRIEVVGQQRRAIFGKGDGEVMIKYLRIA